MGKEAVAPTVKVIQGGEHVLEKMTEGVKLYTDRAYTIDKVPDGFHGAYYFQNPCHTGANFEMEVTAVDTTLFVFVAKASLLHYSSSASQAFTEHLQEAGFEKFATVPMEMGGWKNTDNK